MHRSADRVTRPKKPTKAKPDWKIYPANGPQVDADFSGQYIAFVEGLQKAKPVWKIVAHHEALSNIHQALARLPKDLREKTLIWYIYSPEELAELSPTAIAKDL